MGRYRVLIADDEYYIRQRILKIFPWDSLPVELAGEAESGAEVIAKLSDGIDIVMMDIRMPEPDGLETARYIAERHPSVKMIVFSGYSDFEYAQTALRYGVLDYLLKPVKEEDLQRAVHRAVEALDRERAQTRQIAEYHAHERNRLYKSVLSGKKTADRLAQAFPEFAGSSRCAFAGLYTYGYDADAQGFLSGLRELDILFETVLENESSLLIHLFGDSDGPLETAFGTLAAAMSRESVPRYLVIGAPFAVTEPWKPFAGAVAEALFRRYFTSLPAVDRVRGGCEVSPAPYDVLKIRQKTISYISTKDRQGLERYLEELFDVIERGGDVGQMKLIVSELFSSIYLLSESPAARQTSRMQNLALPLLEEEYQLDYIQTYLLHAGAQLIDRQDSLPSDIAISRKVTAYIEDNYAQPELTVTGIAERYQLNVSYMGSVFKRVNKLSIQQYITAVRMEAAAALLKTGQMKVSDIAVQVGYHDVFYFSKRFKMMFGVSPKEYSQQHAG